MPLGVGHQDFICVSKADVGVRFSPPHTHFFSGLPWRRVLRSCCCQVCNDNARQSHASHRHTYGHTHTHSLRRTVNKSTLYAFQSPTQSPSEHSWACPCRLGPVILKHITCLYRDRGNFLRNLTLICPPQKKYPIRHRQLLFPFVPSRPAVFQKVLPRSHTSLVRLYKLQSESISARLSAKGRLCVL